MAERNPAAARMSSYALNARLVTTTLRRLQAEGEGQKTLPISGRDIARLRDLRRLLVASLQGAELGAATTVALSAPSGTVTVDEKLASHDVVIQTLQPDWKPKLPEFVNHAHEVLVKLERGRWQALQEPEKTFVEDELREFLDRLAHASDFAPPRAREQGLHYTLT